MGGDPTRQDEAIRTLLGYPLVSALFNRRSRRISKGIPQVLAGSFTYKSDQKPQPLDPVEEALLVVATGISGVTLPDMPFMSETGTPLVGSPMLEIKGRTASSPDNAQATHFFMINDSGTYFLRRPADASQRLPDNFTSSDLIALAEQVKVKVLDRRLDLPREYPCYVGRNKYVSNLAGSTVFVPVVDLTKQYINGLMFLLSQVDGSRPMLLDDWNFYRKAGVSKWVKNGFLNKTLPLPLGYGNTFRIHIEADLLIQNLLLTIQAMGLGGWVHAGFAGPLLLGDPEYVEKYGRGLGFRFEKPKKLRSLLLRFITPIPAWRPNPVGLDGVLEGHCPPYYKDMTAAVDAIVAAKYGPGGLYKDPKNFDGVFKPGIASRFLEELPHYSEDVIACTKDICNYIYDTYGRFPAHVDAMYVPGVWVQAHHLDLKYYDQLYAGGYSDTQARHQEVWHGSQ